MVERIIARVNSEIITQRQFEREKTKLHDELSQQFNGADLDAKINEESKNLLAHLIDTSLMVQKAKDEDVNVETDLIKKLDQMRREDNLATIEDLQKDAEQQGVNWEDFKEQIRRQLLMQEVISRDVGSRIVITRRRGTGILQRTTRTILSRRVWSTLRTSWFPARSTSPTRPKNAPKRRWRN